MPVADSKQYQVNISTLQALANPEYAAQAQRNFETGKGEYEKGTSF